MIETINKLRQDFDSRLESISDSKQLEQIRIDFLGKKGQLQGLMKELRNASPEIIILSKTQITGISEVADILVTQLAPGTPNL